MGVPATLILTAQLPIELQASKTSNCLRVFQIFGPLTLEVLTPEQCRVPPEKKTYLEGTEPSRLVVLVLVFIEIVDALIHLASYHCIEKEAVDHLARFDVFS